MNLTDISTIKTLCAAHGFSLSKEFGQNFIVNPGICPKIAEAAGIDERFGVLVGATKQTRTSRTMQASTEDYQWYGNGTDAVDAYGNPQLQDGIHYWWGQSGFNDQSGRNYSEFFMPTSVNFAAASSRCARNSRPAKNTRAMPQTGCATPSARSRTCSGISTTLASSAVDCKKRSKTWNSNHRNSAPR